MKSVSFQIMTIEDFEAKSRGLGRRCEGGNFINTAGEVIGTHDGYPFYTIGQRKLGISFGSDASYVGNQARNQ